MSGRTSTIITIEDADNGWVVRVVDTKYPCINTHEVFTCGITMLTKIATFYDIEAHIISFGTEPRPKSEIKSVIHG